MGAAYGTVKSDVEVASMGAMRPELDFQPVWPWASSEMLESAIDQQPKLFVGVTTTTFLSTTTFLILIFAEALAFYDHIVGIVLSSRAD